MVSFVPIPNAARVEIVWEDGELTGRAYIVTWVREAFERSEKVVRITPTGPTLVGDEIMEDAIGFIRFMEDTFEQYGEVTITGDVPVIESEEGMIY